MAARLKKKNPVQSKNRARPMAARLKKKKPRAEQEPRSAHGRAVNNILKEKQPRNISLFTLISKNYLILSTWAFCLRMREMNGIISVRRHFLFLNALRRVFKRVIYVARKILSRKMKDCNKFTHISNTVDIHSVCRDFR